ncbi:MAG TPA: GDSL-type esterase/lipase family protein [Steroidobacteraceae bacterium]|jgi:lysophospholipase L1-like esterase|nr:GDSL-type esterase/lipase family protein [Steroidobacteraceae bacterium]
MTELTRRSLLAASFGASLVVPSIASAIEGCGEQPNTAPALQPPRLLTDWAWLDKYRQANAELISRGAKVDVVFLGDSITEGWASTDPGFLSGANVGRGISAQTTPQLLVRMHADVVALKPRVVHIMAGTNDIAQNTGPMSPEDSKNNLMAMCEIARAHKIHVVLGSVPPASKYWWRPDLQPKPVAIALNEWMRSYAKQIGAAYADYAAALSDAAGNVKLNLAKDEVHPTPEGYAAMRPIAAAAIHKKR